MERMMASPKSHKLLRDEMSAPSAPPSTPAELDNIKVYKAGEVIPIKKVKCYNDFVAILLFRIDTSIIMAGNSGFKNEGMVVGFGPGLPAGDGKRCPSQLELGAVVTFYGNPTTALEPKSGVYSGQKVVIVPERFVICGLKSVPSKIIEEPEES